MTIGKKIATRRKELGLTLEEVGNAVGVGKSTVKKWESGYIANMRRDKIAALAKVLQMSPSEFISSDGEQTSPGSEPNAIFLDQQNVHMIPLYETVSAGLGAYAINNAIDYIPLYITTQSEADETICIVVSGDSMYPKIEEGDIIQVHKQDSVDSGTIAVILLDGEKGLVKRIEYGPNWIELHSINPMYKTMRFEGPAVQRIQVVGAVKKIIKSV